MKFFHILGEVALLIGFLIVVCTAVLLLQAFFLCLPIYAQSILLLGIVSVYLIEQNFTKWDSNITSLTQLSLIFFTLVYPSSLIANPQNKMPFSFLNGHLVWEVGVTAVLCTVAILVAFSYSSVCRKMVSNCREIEKLYSACEEYERKMFPRSKIFRRINVPYKLFTGHRIEEVVLAGTGLFLGTVAEFFLIAVILESQLQKEDFANALALLNFELTGLVFYYLLKYIVATLWWKHLNRMFDKKEVKEFIKKHPQVQSIANGEYAPAYYVQTENGKEIISSADIQVSYGQGLQFAFKQNGVLRIRSVVIEIGVELITLTYYKAGSILPKKLEEYEANLISAYPSLKPSDYAIFEGIKIPTIHNNRIELKENAKLPRQNYRITINGLTVKEENLADYSSAEEKAKQIISQLDEAIYKEMTASKLSDLKEQAVIAQKELKAKKLMSPPLFYCDYSSFRLEPYEIVMNYWGNEIAHKVLLSENAAIGKKPKSSIELEAMLQKEILSLYKRAVTSNQGVFKMKMNKKRRRR